MPKKAKNFEESMEDLEQVIRQLESGTLSLEASIKEYKRGMDLAAYCSKVLESAKQEVYIYEQGIFKTLNGDEKEEK